MIVTCNSCSKRYLVDPRALGALGRRVRCASCGHTWFEAAPEQSSAPIELPPLPEAMPIIRTSSQRRVQLPAVPPARSRGRFIGWAAVTIMIAVAAWGLVAARASVMSLWPPSSRLYAMIGYGPTEPGFGLALKVVPARGVEDGVPTLTIDGEVANVSTVTRDVPKLRVALRDVDNKVLKSWTVIVTDQRLLPGASVTFHTGVAQPPDAATGVVVSFADSDN